MSVQADERVRRRESPTPGQRFEKDTGPSKPDLNRPGKDDELMKRMKKVNPDQAKKYRQRSGQ
jgi:hypothetical protein